MSIKKMLSVTTLVVFLISTVISAQEPVASAQAEPIRVVALGDSYTSGNGALDYYQKGCYRSWNSYVHQYAALIRQRGHEVESRNFACHGKVTADIPEQVAGAGEYLRNADIVLLTIGGNDAGFKLIVQNCLAVSRNWNYCHDDINRVREMLDEIMEKTKTAVETIRSEVSVSTQIVLVGYPYLIARDCFADADIVRSLQSAADTKAFLMIFGMDDPRVSYLSMLVPFSGGEVCGDGVDGQYIRGTLDTLNFNEWYHPNVEGHAVVARELVRSGVHVKVLEGQNTQPPKSPVYTFPPPVENTIGYANLPFQCGVVVPLASTYDAYNFNGNVLYHDKALDFPMVAGTPVVAVESGVVLTKSDPAGYGNYIDLVGDSGVIHRTAHLQGFAVANNQRVARGATIGTVGNTGASTGPHVHYEQRNANGQIVIDLGGEPLQWGGAQDSSGFRTTTHGLLSENCGSQAVSDRYADIITLSYGHFAYGRSDGYDRDGWGAVKQDVFTPTSVDACDFDGDGWSEFIALDAPTSRLMMADPKVDPNGHFYWRQIGTTQTAQKITCGDWTGDGLADVLMHNVNNSIYVGRSDGQDIVEWRVALTNAGGMPSYWDMCDVNGDGAQDMVSYHASTNRFLVGIRASGVSMTRRELLPGIYNVVGFTCGNFVSGGGDEIVAWQPEQNGRYMLGRFDSGFGLLSWRSLNPTGLSQPHNGEVVSGDIDGDGLDEFVVNERRPRTGDHSIMVGDFSSQTSFAWYPFKDGMQASYLCVGYFVK